MYGTSAYETFERMTPATMWTWSLSTSLRSLVRAVAGRPSLSSRITSSFRPASCQPLSCQKSSQPLYMSRPAAEREIRSASVPGPARRRRRRPTPGPRGRRACGPCARLVAVGDRQLLGGEERDDLGALGSDDHLLLDARRRDTVGRRAVGLDGEDHPRVELRRIVERVEAADDGPLVETEPEPVAEVEAERGHLGLEPDLLRLREGPGDPVGRHPGLDQGDRLVHPLARLLVGADLRRGRAADAEGAVVAGPVPDERLDDVEEGLVTRAHEAVGEVVRVGAAALTRDRVDRLDAVGAHGVEPLRRERHDLVLADARSEGLGDILVDPVHHRRGHVQERELVRALERARLEHHLLAVAHPYARLLKREQEGRLDNVDAEGHVDDALLAEDRLDLARGLGEQARLRRDGAAQADEAGERVLGREPRRVEPVVAGRRPEIPHPGLAVAGQEAPARELIPGPLADDRARDVADIVLVEDEQRAKAGAGQGLANPAQPVGVQAAEVHALLEVHLHVAGRLEGAVPRVSRVDGVRRHTARLGGSLLPAHCDSPEQAFSGRPLL